MDWTRSEADEARSRLTAVARTRDLSAFEDVTRSVEEEWRNGPGDRYAILMRYVCDTLVSMEWGDVGRQTTLAHHYAVLGLKTAEQAPIDVEIELLLRASTAAKAMGITQRMTMPERRRWAEQWLRARQRLEEEQGGLDSGDDESAPRLNVMPPAEAGVLPGSDPDGIEDQRLRAKYKADIERNRELLEALSRRQRLAGLAPEFVKRSEDELVSLYSMLPFDAEELRGLLHRHIKDTVTRQRIMGAVRDVR